MQEGEITVFFIFKKKYLLMRVPLKHKRMVLIGSDSELAPRCRFIAAPKVCQKTRPTAQKPLKSEHFALLIISKLIDLPLPKVS